jgi:phosphatidate cytidylyltransferase
MQRVISGVVLAAAALAAIWFLPLFALRIVATLVAAVASYEYVKVATGVRGGLVVAPVSCWFMASGQPALGFEATAWVMLISAVLEVLVFARPIQNAAAASFSGIYIGVPLGMLVLIQQNFGARATLFLLAAIVVSDTSQYYCGRTFGRHPLAPAISPKKTIEGAIGGVIFGTAFVVLGGHYLFGLSPLVTVPFGIVVVGLGIAGDLFESRLKRVAGMKDSSNLIPGHGGVLDRIDALLFAIPAFYFMLVRSLV